MLPIEPEHLSLITNIMNIITATVSLCSAIAAITPTKKDDPFLAKYVLPVVNMFALNVGNAKNEKKN